MNEPTERKKPGPPPRIDDRRPLTIHVSGEMAEQLKALAEKRRLTVSELARRMLARSLRK